MKQLSEQVADIKKTFETRLDQYWDLNEKYHGERSRLRDIYFTKGLRGDIAERKAEEETRKIKNKIDAISLELDIMLDALEELDIAKIRKELNRIESKYNNKFEVVGRSRTRGILVADGSRMRSDIANLLREHKCDIAAEADNGKRAFEVYKELMPELVILDVEMPDSDGLETLANIMNFDPEAKVIVCSQITRQSTIDETTRLGALDYVTKPFEDNIFLAVVAKAMKPFINKK